MLPGPVPIEELLAQSTWLRRLAATLVAGEAAAEDLVQETWLVALRHPPLGGRSPRPWLARIARNLAANFRRSEARRKQHEAEVPPAEPALDPGSLTGEVEAQRVLVEAVLRLEEPLRSTVVLRYLRGLDSRAIGRLQDVPEGTVRWRLKRALELLRTDLDQRSGGDRGAWCAAFAALLPRQFETTGGVGTSWAAGVSLMSTAMKLGVAAAVVVGLFSAWILMETGDTSERSTDRTAQVEPPESQPAGARGDLASDRQLGNTRQQVLGEKPPVVEPETRACCVVGRVLDPEGRGLLGARIVARAPRLDRTSLRAEVDEEPVSHETTSGPDGVYSLALAGERPFVLSASHPDHPPLACAPVFAGERRDLKLAAGTALTVEVFSTPGEERVRCAGALVDVRVESPDSTGALWSISGTTDSSGVVAFSGLPAGRTDITARSEARRGYSRIDADGSGSVSCSIELLATGRIDGTVVERETGRPIAGARVGHPHSGIAEVATDERGRFALDGLGLNEGLWALGAHAEGFATHFELVKLSPGSERLTLTLALERALRVSGRVVDEAGRAAPNARVCLLGYLPVEPFTAEWDRIRTETDAAGRFAAEVHPGVVYRVLVSAADHGLGLYACGPFPPGSAPVDLDDLVLASACAISGSVTDLADEPCLVKLLWEDDEGGATSTLTRHFAHVETTRPDPGGRFAFAGLAPGRYRVELVQPRSREGAEPAVALVELAPGESRRDLVLGSEGPSVEGTVTNASGHAIRGCRVSLFAVASPERLLASAHTGAHGRFALHTREEGPLRVVVDDPGLLYESRVLEPVELDAGALAIELSEFRSSHAIRGVLVTESGPAPEKTFVAFRDSRTQERLGRVAIPEPDGTFTMHNLRDASYDLELIDFEGRWEPVRIDGVRPGGGQVEVRLIPKR